LKLKIAIILGTRPEIIKMAPIIRELEKQKIDYFMIHSGQHYSYNLDRIFFKRLSLPKPKYKLEVGSRSPGEQTGLIISRVEKVLKKNKPKVVLVEGDTNTVLAGAIAARKLNITVGHVEAGLRSYDQLMPEELNRKLTDHCSDFLFAPTKNAMSNLMSEGIERGKIFVTGNTIVDSVHQNIQNFKNYSFFLKKFGLKKNNFVLVSLHRQENVDDSKKFKELIMGLKLVRKELNMPIIFPIHPRSRKMARRHKINFTDINLINPVDYLTFLVLQKFAKIVLTDSGGVQEETCILKVPCVTLRENTERPETVTIGSNLVSGINAQRILRCVNTMINRKRTWKNPFGDGKAAERIVAIISKK